jgi:hypothetical protein
MSQTSPFEQRVETLERQVAEIRRQLGQTVHAPGWVDQLAGSMKDHPDLDQFVQLGHEARQAHRDPA